MTSSLYCRDNLELVFTTETVFVSGNVALRGDNDLVLAIIGLTTTIDKILRLLNSDVMLTVRDGSKTEHQNFSTVVSVHNRTQESFASLSLDSNYFPTLVRNLSVYTITLTNGANDAPNLDVSITLRLNASY